MAGKSRKVAIDGGGASTALEGLRTEVEHVFERLAQGFRKLRGERQAPNADASESSDGYEISLELPGMDKKDVDITVEGNVLVIAGEKRNEHEEKKRNYYLVERSYGAFRRAFRLPDDVDRDRIGAKFAKGVLEISLPRLPGEQRPVKKVRVS